MQNNPWAQKYGIAPQQAGPMTGPPPVVDPYKREQDAEADARANTNTGLSVESGTRSQKGQVQDFRKEYTASMPVKTYGVAITSAANAVKRGEDASGDIALIYDYAKAMDPESVVRESEVEMAQGGQSMIETAAARYKKEFGVEGGGVLDPKTRERLRREIISAAKSRRQAYEQQRENFTGIAQRNQFNPEDVIGPHLGEPYREELSRFGASGRRFSDDEMAARAARKAGEDYRPESDEIAFGMDAPGSQTSDSVVDRLPPQQEAQLAAYLKARSGDASFSPQEYQAFARSIGVQGDLALDDALVDAVRKGEALPTGIDYSQADEQRRREMTGLLDERGMLDEAKGGMAGFDAGVFANFNDELAGLAGGVMDAADGGTFGEGYRRERDVVRAAQAIGRDERGIGPEIAGGLLSPLNRLGSASTAKEFAYQGAKFGALSGAGAGEGVVGTGVNALLGAGTGAAVGGAVSQAPRAVNALLQTQPGQRVSGAIDSALARGRVPESARELVEAGQRQGVKVRRGDADPQRLAHKRGVARNSEEGNRIIRDAEAEDLVDAEAAALRLGDGNPAGDRFETGERAQAVLERQSKRTKDEAQRLYRVAEDASEGVKFQPQKAIATLNDEITRLEGEGADASLISYLRRQGELLSRAEGWTPMQLHAFRSNLRKNIRTAGLPVDAAELPMVRAIGAAGEDLQQSLSGNARALTAVKRADKIWAERSEFRREVGDKLFGKDRGFSPDQTGAALDSMVRSDSRRFERFMKELDPEEAADLRATFATKLGRDGQGNFSLAKFLTQTEGKGAIATPRSMRLLYGEEGMKAITDLRAIFNAKQAAASETNYSRTGNVVSTAARGLRSLLFAGIGAGTGGTAGAVVAPAASGWLSRVGERRAARLVTNPDFTRWLRQAPESSNPEVINRYFSRLNKIASRDQVFRMDAKAVQDYLARHFSEGVGRAAASGDNRQDNRGEQPR